jgi:hypothetical protein
MDAAGTVNMAYTPSRPILCKLGVILLEHGWQRIWSMQIATAREISAKIRWRLLVAKPLVYVDAQQANSRPSWSIDFLKQSEKFHPDPAQDRLRRSRLQGKCI